MTTAEADHPIDGPPILSFATGAATITLGRPREHNRIDPDDLAREIDRTLRSARQTLNS